MSKQAQEQGTRKVYVDESGYLVDYRTGETIRRATPEEAEKSRRAAERDGGRGVIELGGES